MSRYLKAVIAAVLPLVVYAVSKLIPDFDVKTWEAVVTAALTSAGVWAIPNRPAETPPEDRGESTVIVILLVAILCGVAYLIAKLT